MECPHLVQTPAPCPARTVPGLRFSCHPHLPCASAILLLPSELPLLLLLCLRQGPFSCVMFFPCSALLTAGQTAFFSRRLPLLLLCLAGDQLTLAESYAWRARAGHLPSQDKRKRRRKLPKTSFFRSSRGVQIRRCGRSCAYSPRPCNVPVIMQLQFQQFKVHVSMKIPRVQFIDRVLDIPGMPQRQVLAAPVVV